MPERLRPKKGLQVEYEIFVPLEEYPLGGMMREMPGTKLQPGQSPDMMNCSVISGLLRKRFGFAEFFGPQDAFGGPITGIFSMQDTEDSTHLVATWADALKWFDFATDTWTDTLASPPLTGTDTSPFSFEVSQNDIVFSQGADPVQLFDITTNEHDDLDANCPPARYLTRFADRLVLGFTEEGGSRPFRIRRSIAGDHTDWTGVGSGFVDLQEFPHRIYQIRKTGTRLAVYTERSVQVVTKTEIASAPFRVDPVDTGVGLFADRLIAELPGNRHIFLGTGSANIFDGVQVSEIPNPVLYLLFNTISPSNRRQCFGATFPETHEVLFFITTNSAPTAYPDRVWIYNWARDVWYPWDLGTAAPHVHTTHRQDNTLTIDELIGTIDDQNWEFDSRFIQAAFYAFLTGHEDGHIYRWSGEFASDSGTAISAYWTSRDFEIRDINPPLQNGLITLRSLAIVGVDTGPCDLFVSFSIDGGGTWIGPEEISFTSNTPGSVIEKQVTRQVTGARIRFKIENNALDQTFQIHYFRPVFEARASHVP